MALFPHHNSFLTYCMLKKRATLPLFALLLVSTLVIVIIPPCDASTETKQAHIHAMGHNVMPFSLAKTLHVFKMTESGGIQKVIVKNPADIDQIRLIRQHLKHVADKFQHGDYSDPARLHGKNMPGIKELHSGASQVSITYHNLPLGAEIVFSTPDIHLLTALHRWFGAQLSEHGADARAE